MSDIKSKKIEIIEVSKMKKHNKEIIIQTVAILATTALAMVVFTFAIDFIYNFTKA